VGGAGNRDAAAVGLLEAGDEREQRRLAGAAAADDPDPPPRRHVQVEAVEHGASAEHAADALGGDPACGLELRFDQRLRRPLPSPA
jgi:hypothetical protein